MVRFFSMLCCKVRVAALMSAACKASKNRDFAGLRVETQGSLLVDFAAAQWMRKWASRSVNERTGDVQGRNNRYPRMIRRPSTARLPLAPHGTGTPSTPPETPPGPHVPMHPWSGSVRLKQPTNHPPSNSMSKSVAILSPPSSILQIVLLSQPSPFLPQLHTPIHQITHTGN